MGELIRVALTDAQVAEFVALDREEAQARKTLEAVPVARQYAARAIILGQYPLAMIVGQRIDVNEQQRALIFEPNLTAPALVPDDQQEAAS